jgi:hypothetical protein
MIINISFDVKDFPKINLLIKFVPTIIIIPTKKMFQNNFTLIVILIFFKKSN